MNECRGIDLLALVGDRHDQGGAAATFQTAVSCAGGSAVMRRLFVAEPVLVPRRAHLILVAEPVQVLRGDAYPRWFRRGRWSMRGLGGHNAIVSVPRPARFRDR